MAGTNGVDRRFPLLLVLLASFSIALLGSAAAFASAAPPQPPLELPPAPAAAVSGIRGATTSDSGAVTWIVAGRPDARTSRIASKLGATPVSTGSGMFRIDRDQAVAMATALKHSGRLVFTEPDEPIVSTSYPDDLYQGLQWWLDAIVNPVDTTPPPVKGSSPRLALIEESIDPLHPDLAKARIRGAKSLSPARDSHGTAVAAIAGSPGEGAGIRGVWPGMKMRLFPSGTTCSTATAAVIKAARHRVAVINMSYALPADGCFSHYVATEFAVKKGALPVASAGNSYPDGNTPVRPAIDPHVLSVSALDVDRLIGGFATRNDGVDITAPGVGVFAPTVTAISSADGSVTRGWANLSGTSFSAPMVAAAATWLRQARPRFDASRAARALTHSATDLGSPGRDPEYGEGLLDIDAALTAPTPPRDRMEPNDDIKWLNGSLIGKSRFLYKPRSGKRSSVTATLSRDKDPSDVYRVKIRRRSKVLITVAQFQGNVRLEVFRPRVKSIRRPRRHLIVRSDRPKDKTEGVRVRNLKRKAQTIYVAVTPSPRTKNQYFRYRLTVKR